MISPLTRKPISPDSWAAFILLQIILLVGLPWWKVVIFDALVFGVALPLVLIDRRMSALQKAGKNPAIWLTIALVYALLVLAGIFVVHLHRDGLLAWWPA